MTVRRQSDLLYRPWSDDNDTKNACSESTVVHVTETIIISHKAEALKVRVPCRCVAPAHVHIRLIAFKMVAYMRNHCHVCGVFVDL